MNFERVNDKTWKSGYLTFVDLGHIEGGITHRFEVRSGDPQEHMEALGWVMWKAGWRKYTFKSIAASIWLDDGCLTTIAEFAKMQTDERKLHWKGH